MLASVGRCRETLGGLWAPWLALSLSPMVLEGRQRFWGICLQKELELRGRLEECLGCIQNRQGRWKVEKRGQ